MQDNSKSLAPQDLLKHSPFIRSLARGLFRDGNSVDDLVQETWLAVLRNPPRSELAARSWFRTVSRNLFLKKTITEQRLQRREIETAKIESLPSTADIAVQESVRQEVIQVVCALPEPLRQTLLLRYYEDLPPRKIAQQLGISVEAVQSQIKKGLRQMRLELDARHHKDRKTWCTGLAALAQFSKPLDPWRLTGPVRKLAALVLLTGFVVTAIWLRALSQESVDDSPALSKAYAKENPQNSSESKAANASTTAVPEQPLSLRSHAQPSEIHGAELRITGTLIGQKNSHEEIELMVKQGSHILWSETTRTDTNGYFSASITKLPRFFSFTPIEVSARPVKPGYGFVTRTFEAANADALGESIYLEPHLMGPRSSVAAVLRGRVVDRQGHPIGNAFVHLSENRPWNLDEKTDEHGRYALIASTPGEFRVGAYHPGNGSAIQSNVMVDPSTFEISVPDIVLGGHGMLSGTVRSLNGLPKAGITLICAQADQATTVRAFEMVTGMGRFAVSTENPFQMNGLSFGVAKSDQRGEFQFEGLIPGEYLIYFCENDGPKSASKDTYTIGTAGIELLHSSRSLRVDITDSEHRIVPGANTKWHAWKAGANREGKPSRQGDQRGETFLLDVETEDTVRVEVSAPGAMSVSRSIEIRGQTQEDRIQIVLEAQHVPQPDGILHLQLIHPEGKLFGQSSLYEVLDAKTDHQVTGGFLEIGEMKLPLPEGNYRLQLRLGSPRQKTYNEDTGEFDETLVDRISNEMFLPVSQEFRIGAGKPTELKIHPEKGGVVLAKLAIPEEEQGKSFQCTISFRALGQHLKLGQENIIFGEAPERYSHLSYPLPAGSYELRVHAKGYPDAVREILVTTGQMTREEIHFNSD